MFAKNVMNYCVHVVDEPTIPVIAVILLMNKGMKKKILMSMVMWMVMIVFRMTLRMDVKMLVEPTVWKME